MSIKAKIITLEIPPLGKLIDTLEQQPPEIQEQLRQLRQARTAGVPLNSEPAKSCAHAVLKFYTERALTLAGVNGIITVDPDGTVEEMLRTPHKFPPEVQERLQALLDAGANPDLHWDELSAAAKAAVKEHGPFLHEYWEKHCATLQPPSAADDTTSFSA